MFWKWFDILFKILVLIMWYLVFEIYFVFLLIIVYVEMLLKLIGDLELLIFMNFFNVKFLLLIIFFVIIKLLNVDKM